MNSIHPFASIISFNSNKTFSSRFQRWKLLLFSLLPSQEFKVGVSLDGIQPAFCIRLRTEKLHWNRWCLQAKDHFQNKLT